MVKFVDSNLLLPMNYTEVYSESNKISNVELFAKIIKKSIKFLAKSSILDIRMRSECASVFQLEPTLVETKYH